MNEFDEMNNKEDSTSANPGIPTQESHIDWQDQNAGQPQSNYPPNTYQAPQQNQEFPPQSQQTSPQGYQIPPQGYQIPPQGYPAPPQGYQIPPQGYPAPPQGYPIPPQGYPAPPQGYYQPYYPQPKKKMNTGLKVFLFVASFLFVGTVFGFAAVTAFSFVGTNMQVINNEYEQFAEQPPVEPEHPTVPPEKNPLPEAVPDEPIQIPDIDVKPNSTGLSINNKPAGAELSAQDAYAKVLKSTVTVSAVIPMGEYGNQESVGSGIIITADGFIITNAHVVGNTKSSGVTISTSDGNEYPAVVVGFDKATDLALLKADDHGFTPAEIGNSDELNIGEWVVAIGNPGGSGFTGSLTRGVVSGLDRAVGYSSDEALTYIQTDAAINPGNSGGPLVNMYGQVVGINTSKIVANYYEGMGFAIPAISAKGVIDELLLNGYVSGRVRLGITGQNVQEADAYMLGYPAGINIIGIDENSSFTGTDAQVGDIITAVDDEAIADLSRLSGKFLSYKPGDKAKVTIYRPNPNGGEGSTFDVTITLLEDNGETQK